MPVTSTNILALLKSNHLFRGLSNATLEHTARIAKYRVAERGAVLFHQGDPGDGFYGIDYGRVRMSSTSSAGREIYFVELGPGDTFGEIALLDDGPRTASAIVAEPAAIIIIERHAFRSILRNDNDLCLKMLTRLCERVRWTSELVEDHSFLSVEAQIAKRIRLLSERFGTDVANGRQLKITQHDLAAFLGVSRQAINTYLSRWQHEGWLEVSRGSLCIRDTDRLTRV
ncbi:MAG TPA: Crp/Fnr family transcriptional regulator [Woeseiaceae bacterium]|nr:Crp/Fnr family transcriptional regulator [Woeseiaceae bacterium]